MEFINKSISEIEKRIDVETFCGAKILRVDGRRVGHAMDEDSVERMKRYLATALPDLESLFVVLGEQQGFVRGECKWSTPSTSLNY